MASISYDGQSFTINGHRRWLVGAVIDPGRLPRCDWLDRIRAARQAGFNTIIVRLSWAQHEPEQGKFDFTGHLDVRHFVQLIAAEGMLAILRPGPFVGADWDAGGLPGWLIDSHPEIVRTGDPAFKEAVGRYFSSLFDQVNDLQLISRGAGGPIILIQNEHAWFRGDPLGAEKYLTETARYLREVGVIVPIINTNNLYASSPNELDGWLADGDLYSTLLQLRTVHPDTPAFAMDIPLASTPAWGESAPKPFNPDEVVTTLAHTLAACGQPFVDSLCAGLTPGFLAGRDPQDADRFMTSPWAPAAPIAIDGQRTKLYARVKEITTFATSFELVLANLDPQSRGVTLQPDASNKSVGPAVVGLSGSQGDVTFIFAQEQSKATTVTLSLPDGRALDVPLADQQAVWLLSNTLIGQRATLDYCNLSAFANVGDVFVCFGKAGSRASLSIDDAELHATVPGGKSPLIVSHADVTVVICSLEQIEAAIATPDAIFIGTAGLDEQGEPLPDKQFPTCVRISKTGQVDKIAMKPASSSRRRPSLLNWAQAPQQALITGDTDHLKPIENIAPNAALGSSIGPVWIHCKLRTTKPHIATVGFFELRPRAHIYLDGQRLEIIGSGAGANGPIVKLPLIKGEQALTILADQLGRPAGGAAMGEAVGLSGELWEIAPYKIGKPKLVASERISPITAIPSRVWDMHDDELTDAHRITWTFTYRRTAPLYASITNLPAPALITLNNTAIAWLTQGGPTSFRLDPDVLRRGGNTLEIITMDNAKELMGAYTKAFTLYEGIASITAKRPWSFAPCAPPASEHFIPTPKSSASQTKETPTWWRCSFKLSPNDPAVSFVAAGLSKGHLLINDHVAGRYFTSLETGKKVGPLTPIPIFPQWLNEDGKNELFIFDEFGFSPDKCKLVST